MVSEIKVEKGEVDMSSSAVNESIQDRFKPDSSTLKTESTSRGQAYQEWEGIKPAKIRHQRNDSSATVIPAPRLRSPVSFVSKPSSSSSVLISHSFKPEEKTFLALWKRRGLHTETIIWNFESTFKRRVEQRDVTRILNQLEGIPEVVKQLIDEAKVYSWYKEPTEGHEKAMKRFEVRADARKRNRDAKTRAMKPPTVEDEMDKTPKATEISPINFNSTSDVGSSKASTARLSASRLPEPGFAKAALSSKASRSFSDNVSYQSRAYQAPQTPPLSSKPKVNPAPTTPPITPGSTLDSAIYLDTDDEEDEDEDDSPGLDDFCTTGRMRPTPLFSATHEDRPSEPFPRQTSPTDLLRATSHFYRARDATQPVPTIRHAQPSSAPTGNPPTTHDALYELRGQKSSSTLRGVQNPDPHSNSIPSSRPTTNSAPSLDPPYEFHQSHLPPKGRRVRIADTHLYPTSSQNPRPAKPARGQPRAQPVRQTGSPQALHNLDKYFPPRRGAVSAQGGTRPGVAQAPDAFVQAHPPHLPPGTDTTALARPTPQQPAATNARRAAPQNTNTSFQAYVHMFPPGTDFTNLVGPAPNDPNAPPSPGSRYTLAPSHVEAQAMRAMAGLRPGAGDGRDSSRSFSPDAMAEEKRRVEGGGRKGEREWFSEDAHTGK